MRFITNNLNLSREQAEELLLRPRDRLALDIETVSLLNTLPLGIGVAISPTVGFYFFNPRDELLMRVVAQTPTMLIHNASFDVPELQRLGFIIQSYEDTMLLAYSAGILEKSLDSLASSMLGRTYRSVTSQWRKKDQGNIAIDHVVMGGICIDHACFTYALWDKIPKTPLYRDIDRPCVDLVIEMEKWGVLIDQVKLTEVDHQTTVRANGVEQELKEELGDINLASNPQVAESLRRIGIIGTRKTKSDKDSVGEDSLKPLNHPLANKLLKWRSLMKTLTTYVPAFRSIDPNGRIHTVFGYTNTGRWSSGNKKQGKPNLQNITRDEKFQEED